MTTTLLHLFFLLLSVFLIFLDHTATAQTANSIVLSLTYSGPTDFPTTPDNISPLRRSRSSNNNKYSPKKTSETPLKETQLGFTMSLPLGTPPQLIQYIYFDTGSDLVWVPCNMPSFNCIDCDEYRIDSSSFFRPNSSHSITKDSCSSPLCLSLHDSVNYYDMCTIAHCPLSLLVSGNKCAAYPCPPFAFTYYEGVATGILATDILGVAADKNNPKKISFGCVGATRKEPSGVAGFGRGPLSLPSQLGFANQGFSYCFLPFEYSGNPNISTPLILGDPTTSSDSDHNLQFTPMLKNNPTNHTDLYYIGLEAITVGDLPPIQAPRNLKEFDSSGNGGMMIDSGTSYTHLPQQLYSQFLSDLESLIHYPRDNDMEEWTVFDLCYSIPTTKKNNTTNSTGIPSITLHFSNDVSLTLPQGTCFYKMAPPEGSAQTNCLLFQKMDIGAQGDNSGPAGIFGSFQQQNVEVVYDLKNDRIGFQPTDCVSQAKYHGLQKT
ncbi:hypothetical protein OROHE_024792 [Orobanche hederae]